MQDNGFVYRGILPIQTLAPLVASSETLVVTNTTGSTLTDMSVPFSLDTSALISSEEMADDGGIQVKTSGGTLVPYWKEGTVPSASTTYWLKAASLPPGDTFFNVFFSREEVFPTYFEKENVFQFFDDFDGPSLDPKWTATTGSPTITGGQLGIGAGDGVFAGTTPISHDTVVEAMSSALSSIIGASARISTTTGTGFVGDGGAGLVSLTMYTTSIYGETSSGSESLIPGGFNTSGILKKFRIDYRPSGAGTAFFDYDNGLRTTTMVELSSSGTMYPVIFSASGEFFVDWVRTYKYYTDKITTAFLP